jgi:hypothetical protein
MGRGITLKGAAAAGFINARRGLKPKSEEEKYERVLAFLELHIKSRTEKDRAIGIRLLRLAVEGGIDKAVEAVSSEPTV